MLALTLYDTALNHAPASPCPDLDSAASNATPDADDGPTLGEVRRAIQKLKNGRAGGPDGIQPELLKYAEIPTSTALHDLFAQVWRTGRVPSEWCEGIVVSLYKGKGPRTSCGSYRPISLLSVPGSFCTHPTQQAPASAHCTSTPTAVGIYQPWVAPL